MKKRLIAASIVFVLLMPLIFSGCNNPEQEGFAIYLTKDNVPVSQMEALSHVEIANVPVFSDKDIISYSKESHEIELTAEAYERVMQLEVPTTGKSFVVCVDRSPIYWGAFWTPLSSISFNCVMIGVPSSSEQENTIRLALGYPLPSFYQGEDPRSNPVILESLDKAGKLK